MVCLKENLKYKIVSSLDLLQSQYKIFYNKAGSVNIQINDINTIYN